MLIKSNRPGDIGKRSAFVVILFFAYVTITTAIIINIDDGNFGAIPVYEEYFGKFFVIGHLGALTGFIFLFTALIVLNKTGYLKSPQLLYIEQEKKQFKHRYNLSFSEGISKRKRNLVITAAIASTFLPAVIPMIAIYFFNLEDHTLAAVIGIILMFIGFYHAIGYLMSKSKVQVEEILKVVNSLHKNTKLESSQYGLDNKVVSVNFDMSFSGTYKGCNVNVEYKTEGYSTGRHVRVNTSSTVVLETVSGADFILNDRDPNWEKIEFRSIDDGFTKRFNYNSKNGYYLNQKTKELFLMYNRFLNITMQNGRLIYNIQNVDVLPFYTIEGAILFLDFLLEVTEHLEGIDS